MNYFQTHGLETWKSHSVLPGAKEELVAEARLFARENAPLCCFVYPLRQAMPVESLLNHFWQAIEVAGHCQGVVIPFEQIKAAQTYPRFILGCDLAEMIENTVNFDSNLQNHFHTLEAPQAVFETQALKASWWQGLSKLL